MAELPRPVAGYMAGVSKGKLLIIGGSYWNDGQKYWFDQVQIYDPATNKWSVGSSLPEGRSDAASATLGEDIYVFGGGSNSNVVKDALVLHEGKWNRVPNADLPEPRLYSNAVAARGCIYLLGGMSKAGDYKNMSNSFWRWRPGNNNWEILPPLPGPGRINHAMAEVNGVIYVFGGAASGPKDVQNLNDAYSFDLNTRKWTRLSDLNVANRSWWAIGVGTRALILAGYTDTFAREVYWYQPGHGLEPAGELPHGLADVKFYQIGNMVVGTGGEAGPGVRGKWTVKAELPTDHS
ncbi:MAG TPA: kelch repeat-containing protein [Terriglobales bacterium]|nr:kelch repeat-containing protein [Terriglobales bacterium]